MSKDETMDSDGRCAVSLACMEMADICGDHNNPAAACCLSIVAMAVLKRQERMLLLKMIEAGIDMGQGQEETRRVLGLDMLMNN